MTAIDMLRKRSADITAQAEQIHAYQLAGEGSSTCVQLDMLIAESEFLVALGRELVGQKSTI